MTSTTDRPARRSGTASPAQLLPGLLTAVLAVGVAMLVNHLIPVVNALTVAVLLGIVAGNVNMLPASVRPGLAWATRWLLRTGVVLLGLQLAIPQVLGLGAGVLLVVLSTVVTTFAVTVVLGRLLGLPRGLSLLVGAGFSICGVSAIAAVEGVVRREEEDVATAVALVTLYGTATMLVLPLLAGPFGLTAADFGRWAGASVHEVAQVVAATSSAGLAAAATAMVLKLSRVVLLAPLVTGISLAERRRHTPAAGGKRPPLVPLFVLGFLAAALVGSSRVLPPSMLDAAQAITTLLLAGALFGLGSTVRIGALFRTGPKALLLGLLSTTWIVTASLAGLALLS